MHGKVINIFFAYANDSRELLDIAKRELEIINLSMGGEIQFNIREWSSSTISAMGNPEKRILDQMPVDESNFFVGLFRFKYGKPTGNINPDTGSHYKSGMEEEFFTAYRLWRTYNRPQIMIFRSAEDIPRQYATEYESQRAMESFFSEFSSSGLHPGLYKIFHSKQEFGELFRQSILTHVHKEIRWEDKFTSGVFDIYFEDRNANRNEAKQKELRQTSVLKLQARTGFSYLMPKTTHTPLVIAGLERKMKTQIVIQNPWSVNSVLTLLRRDDFVRERDYNEYLRGVLPAEKLLNTYFSSHWLTARLGACMQSYQNLRRQYGNLIELRLSNRDLSNSILLTDNYLFWEPYFGIVEYDKKSLSVFEVQVDNKTALYDDAVLYFDRLWRTSFSYGYFKKNQNMFKERLRQALV